MVRAWFMNETNEDQREPHFTDPPKFVELEKLKLFGVEYFKFPVQNLDTNQEFIGLKNERGYTYEDVCEISRDTLPNYDEKIKNFFTEHLHADDEIRYVAAGSGYFDVRDKEDQWIRIELSKDEMIILPSGIYHRFTVDGNNYIKARRFFIGEPVWTAHNRPAEDQLSRSKYCQRFGITA